MEDKINEQRTENAKLYREDHPPGDDPKENSFYQHSINLIMLGYAEYLPDSKLLKVTEAGNKRAAAAMRAYASANQRKD